MYKNRCVNGKAYNLTKKCLAGTIAITLLLSATPIVTAQQNTVTTNVKQLVKEDEQEINRTEEGDITYVVSTEKDSLKEKYNDKVVDTNETQEDYQDDSFIIADVSRSDINAIDKTKDTIVEKDYLLEGSGESNETWQKSLDYVVDGAWDVKAIHAENADLPKKVTKKVKIAVLDSGADKFSAGQLAGSVNFVNPDEDGFGNDATGHGTAVQNVILSDGETTKSVLEDNKAVELYSVKVLDENNQAPISRIIAAINWCIDNGMNVVNMSFGTLAKSQILQDAIERADKAGVLLIAAAGNSGEADGSTVEYPAAYPQVLGVGSVNQKMEVSEFSSRGKGVDLVAPGENVPVTVPWGFYGVQSGTSFAAPHVTAVAGILWAQNRSKTSAEIASLLRASANAAWDKQEAGNGIVDLDYAEQVADTYQVSDENKVSQSNEDQLTEYAVPTVVQDRWAKQDNQLYYDKSGLHYSHKGLLQQATAIDISADQMQYLYAAIQLPDDRKNIVYKKTQNGKVIEKKTFSECRALHAGRYSSPATDEKAYSNYVATCRCLYNCAYLLEYEGYSKDQLKTYINNHYDSNLQDSQDIKDAKKDLRIAVNVAYDNTFQLKDSTGTLTLANKRKLLFLAFALHTATDAYSHQYVIRPTEYASIRGNTRLERLNGVLFGAFGDNTPAKINFHFSDTTKMKTKFDSGKCVIKMLDYFATETKCHEYYDDNISYIYDRYNLAAKNAVTHLLSLYTGTKINKFDPRIFVNSKFNGSDLTGRIPIFNLKANVRAAGYTPSQWIKSTVTKCGMDTAWERLSHW